MKTKTYRIMYFLFSFLCVSIEQNEKFDDVKDISDYADINMLLAVQLLLPTSDSKDFVDRATKKPIKEITEDFKAVQKDLNLVTVTDEILSIEHAITETRISDFLAESLIARKKEAKKKEQYSKIQILKNFIDKNFHPVGYDIINHDPKDFKETPAFMKNMKLDSEIYKVSKALNEIWKDLSRKKNAMEKGSESSLLDLPFPFMIPGGRFREYYYWDTYWILEGLLVCDMTISAENIVRNFISIINTYGYIPNGTRKYYLHRSEPPFFSMMLLKLLDYEGEKFNKLVMGEGLQAALKEYDFWDKNRKIEVKDDQGVVHYLNHFHVATNFPRPESFSEDLLTYERQQGKSEVEVFSNIKSGAESGWDFSSRWLEKETELKTIEAFYQIPVDLNAILYRNERILHTLLTRNKDEENAKKFLELSEKRKTAINAILWNPKENSWMDYVVSRKTFVDSRFYFSNVTPMIYGLSPPEGTTNYDILYKYSKEIFGYPGGIPASGDNGVATSQQWDFPNVWAPHQHMMVEYLLGIDERNMAFHVAKSFYNSVYEGFKAKGEFYEKYNCNVLGSTGGGGEYAPQTGFGWTNGTALSFILKYGEKIDKKYDFALGYKRIVENLSSKKSKVALNINEPQKLDALNTEGLPFKNDILVEGLIIK